MSKVLIAGIGNAMLGDDGVGPFTIKVLESQYEFPDNVELADPCEFITHFAKKRRGVLDDRFSFDPASSRSSRSRTRLPLLQ